MKEGDGKSEKGLDQSRYFSVNLRFVRGGEKRRKHFGRTNVIFEFGLSFRKYYFYDGELKAGNAKMYSGDTSETYPSTSQPQMAIFCIKKKKKSGLNGGFDPDLSFPPGIKTETCV